MEEEKETYLVTYKNHGGVEILIEISGLPTDILKATEIAHLKCGKNCTVWRKSHIPKYEYMIAPCFREVIE